MGALSIAYTRSTHSALQPPRTSLISFPSPPSFLFHSSSSAFSHVLPLCFKALRLSMRTGALLQPPVKLMQFNFRLDCMPAAPFDMEKKVRERAFGNAPCLFVFVTALRRACWTGTSIAKASSVRCVDG